MSKIYKYPLLMTGEQTVTFPKGSRIIHVGVQDGIICIWARVDPDAEPRKVSVYIYGTGDEVPDDIVEHAGTVITPNGFVWHVYLKQ